MKNKIICLALVVACLCSMTSCKKISQASDKDKGKNMGVGIPKKEGFPLRPRIPTIDDLNYDQYDILKFEMISMEKVNADYGNYRMKITNTGTFPVVGITIRQTFNSKKGEFMEDSSATHDYVLNPNEYYYADFSIIGREYMDSYSDEINIGYYSYYTDGTIVYYLNPEKKEIVGQKDNLYASKVDFNQYNILDIQTTHEEAPRGENEILITNKATVTNKSNIDLESVQVFVVYRDSKGEYYYDTNSILINELNANGVCEGEETSLVCNATPPLTTVVKKYYYELKEKNETGIDGRCFVDLDRQVVY